MTEMLYKALGENAEAIYGTGKWHLPRGKRPGKWMPPVTGALVACGNGYHLCRGGDLLGWIGPRIFVGDYKGERLDKGDKIVVRQARLLRETGWNKCTARLFACDCASRALARIDNPDQRSIAAVRTARLFANGEATRQELIAARDAARDAAWNAAWAAAGAAARAAAWAAAWAAERKWQTSRLLEYLEEGGK